MAIATATLEPIEADAVYPQETFLKRVGWGRKALSVARRQGPRVIPAGGRNFIRGDDFLQYLDRLSREQSDPEAN